MSCPCRCHHRFPPTPYPLGWWYYPICESPGHASPPYGRCPSCGKSQAECACGAEPTVMLPEQLEASAAAPTPPTAFVGGISDVRLTLEYLPDPGSTAAAVTLTITGAEGTDTVKLENIPAGYHVKDDLVAVAPGSTVTLEIANCTARVRWCEEIACR